MADKKLSNLETKSNFRNQCSVTSISINDLTIDTVDISGLISNDFAKWYKATKLNQAFYQESKVSFDAGNPTASQAELEKLFSHTSDSDHELALFNPLLDAGIAVSDIQEYHKKVLVNSFAEINSLSTSELRDKYQDLSEDDEFVDFLSYLQDSLFEGSGTWDYVEAAESLLLDAYLILSKGSKDKKSALKEFFPETYRFIASLMEKRIVEPYLFWTLSGGGHDYFNRISFETEHDSRILAIKESLSDIAAESSLIYPSEFKPLESIDSNYIYNIESGHFALTNELIETADLGLIGFETSTGMGDGYYPTIPFFDQLGELQMVTTFFTHMTDSDELDSLLENRYDPGMHSHRIPLEMGYLDCDGSFFFGDSTWFHNGPGDDLIIEFTDLPVDKYLVVRHIDTEEENRTWAVSVMRDKAKRNYEILFKVFPELTNRDDDF
jgi:hypothetical protein